MLRLVRVKLDHKLDSHSWRTKSTSTGFQMVHLLVFRWSLWVGYLLMVSVVVVQAGVLKSTPLRAGVQHSFPIQSLVGRSLVLLSIAVCQTR